MSEQVDSVGIEEEENANINVNYSDETIVWQGGPSQWINAPAFILWFIFIALASVFLIAWKGGMQSEYQNLFSQYNDIFINGVTWACYVLISISVLSILHAALAVYYERTTITKNKIKEAKGITRIFRQELFCEISDIKDIKSPPPGLLGVLGLSTLIIETNDEDQPIIKIRAIRNRDELIKNLLPIWRQLKIERKGYFGDR